MNVRTTFEIKTIYENFVLKGRDKNFLKFSVQFYCFGKSCIAMFYVRYTYIRTDVHNGSQIQPRCLKAIILKKINEIICKITGA